MANDSVARAMAATAMSETPIYTSDLINDGNGVSPFSLVSLTGYRIDLECNTSDYKLVAKLYDKNNNLLNTSTEIDLPLESLVVNVQYDAANQKLIVTLKNGTTIDVPLSGLISGLATLTWVQSQGYLTEHQSLDGYATESWVEDKGYLTEHQSLADYSTTSEMNSAIAAHHDSSKADLMPNITIAVGQVISQNPLQVQFTAEQAALIEDTKQATIRFDFTQLGMGIACLNKIYELTNTIGLDGFPLGENKHAVISYTKATKIGEYTVTDLLPKLTAGTNITIGADNVISASSGDNVLVCTFTGNSCDKTFAEISTALESNARVIGKYNDLIYQVSRYTGTGITFNTEFKDNGNSTYIYSIYLTSSNNITYSSKEVPNIGTWYDSTYWTKFNINGTIRNIPQVSGTDDGTNWTSLTVNGTTKNIPSGGGGSEPAAYLKSASVSNNTLTLTNKDDTTVTYTPSVPMLYLKEITGDASTIEFRNHSSSIVLQLNIETWTFTTSNGTVTKRVVTIGN